MAKTFYFTPSAGQNIWQKCLGQNISGQNVLHSKQRARKHGEERRKHAVAQHFIPFHAMFSIPYDKTFSHMSLV